MNSGFAGEAVASRAPLDSARGIPGLGVGVEHLQSGYPYASLQTVQAPSNAHGFPYAKLAVIQFSSGHTANAVIGGIVLPPSRGAFGPVARPYTHARPSRDGCPGHYTGHLSTMTAPSPCRFVNEPVTGDPVVTCAGSRGVFRCPIRFLDPPTEVVPRRLVTARPGPGDPSRAA